MIQRVLVPLDSVEAAHPALQLARTNFPQARVDLLHLLPVVPTGAEFALGDVAADDYAEAQRRLVALGGGEVLAGGDPATEILRRAAAGAVDLVVMGTGGKRGLPRLLLGSVAERVVRECPVPVLTVRTDPAPADPRPLRRLLVLMDFSPAACRAHSFAQAQFPGARIDLLHVVPSGTLEPPMSISEAGRGAYRLALQARNQEWAEEARRRLAALGGGELVEGEAADVALKCAERGPWDALVLGTATKSGFEHLLFGSVAQQVVRESTIPVLTAGKPRQPASRP